MRVLKQCPILVGVVVISIILSIVSLVFMNTTYSDYADKYMSGDFPLLVLSLKGATEGVYPFDEQTPAQPLLADEDTEEGKELSEDAGEITATEEIAPEGAVETTVPEETQVVEETPEIPEDITYEFTDVDDDYFLDAVFIGDSRTVGLSEYCEPLDTRAKFYAKISLTIFDVLTKEFIKTDEGKINVETALSNEQYGKVYIMLGLNEIGTGNAQYFKNAYEVVINRIKELQPDAIIYIQGIMHVTANKSDNDPYYNNEKINERNAAISELADNHTVFYLDMNVAIDDENGNLEAGLSFDDVHLKASSYERWHEFLLHNAIVR